MSLKKENKEQPISNVKWLERDLIKPNGYNPNSQARPEFKLLITSILEDGWTQPIVINPDYTIVDGFHRWSASEDKKIIKAYGTKVPVVMMSPIDEHHQQMSTIRHNRARGNHAVSKMGEIVTQMLKQGLSTEEVMKRLSMDREEVERLSMTQGLLTTIDGDFTEI